MHRIKNIEKIFLDCKLQFSSRVLDVLHLDADPNTRALSHASRAEGNFFDHQLNYSSGCNLNQKFFLLPANVVDITDHKVNLVFATEIACL